MIFVLNCDRICKVGGDGTGKSPKVLRGYATSLSNEFARENLDLFRERTTFFELACSRSIFEIRGH
jgi:hypothetical protein